MDIGKTVREVVFEDPEATPAPAEPAIAPAAPAEAPAEAPVEEPVGV